MIFKRHKARLQAMDDPTFDDYRETVRGEMNRLKYPVWTAVPVVFLVAYFDYTEVALTILFLQMVWSFKVLTRSRFVIDEWQRRLTERMKAKQARTGKMHSFLEK